MKFFASVSQSDAVNYHPEDYPYPFTKSVENQPAIYWHVYNKDFGIRYQVWNKNTIKNKELAESAKKPFQADNGKFKRIIISHGFGEHLLIYNRLAYELVTNFKDIEVCVFEYRGSGLCLPVEDLVQEYKLANVGEVEGFKYSHPLSNDKLYKATSMKGETNRVIQLDQLAEFVSFFKKRNGKGQIDIADQETETILFGHSLGGQLATEYALNYLPKTLAKQKKSIKIEDYYLDGLVLCGPLYFLAPSTRPPSVLISVSKLLSKMIPNVKVDSELAVNEITNDKQVMAFMTNDFPYLAPCIGSILMFYQMIATGEELATEKYYKNLSSKDISLLPKKITFVHGKEDGVNDYKGTQQVFNILSNKFKEGEIDLSLFLVENGKHSLFVCNELVFNDFINYISN
ncbi:hypothetical protein HANVADRAFT_5095 [Hanseniaspora valbyensis NRRL Y-1626]|uniref:Serine aminopeptidase S33 domain-containing protein n=1 Tax=Hanseniaspora valbyensis NRRL Y-1626 TaxID=766949 RepID=A0A1B7TJ85_9ASCO|nr:hypothetical protein HANVADRAFT_5095 [Hanseniaspora valbyensis NRRL Y-1626]